MRESNSQISSATPRRSSNRLIFDRRYGWVLDEWKDPAEEALTGGRGMFCIVPLARAFLQLASQSINLVGSSAVKVLERREELLSPQVLQTSLNDQLNKFVSSIQKEKFNFFTLKASQPTCSPSHADTQKSESNMG